MSTKKPRIPAYRLHRQSGQAIVTLPDPLGGRHDVLLGTHGTPESELEYTRVVMEWQANGRRRAEDARKTNEPSSLSINEVLLAFWEHAQSYYVKDGRKTDEVHCLKSAMKPLKELYGETDVGRFGPLALKSVRQRMIELGWTRRYINASVGRLKYIFRWGKENEIVPPSVYEAIRDVQGLQAGRCAAKESKPRHPVAEESIAAVKEDVSEEVGDLIDLQLLTAARPGEVLDLTTGSLDMAGKVWTVQVDGHKMEHFGKRRTLFIGPRAQLILRKYLKADPTAGLFSYTRDAYRRAITRACERLKLLRWTPHWLRHSAGTRLRSEFGIEAAQVILGHSNLPTTELYAAKDTKRAIEIMGEAG